MRQKGACFFNNCFPKWSAKCTMVLWKGKGEKQVSEEQKTIEKEAKAEKTFDKTVDKKEKKLEEVNIKQVTVLSVAFFLTFCCCILFFFLIYRYNGLADYWSNIALILQPVTIGFVLAYLLNPIVKTIESKIKKPLEKLLKNKKRVKSVSRMIGIAGAWILFVLIIAILVAMILPSLGESILSMVKSLPDEVDNLMKWINKQLEDDTEVAAILNQAILQGSEYFENWFKNTFLPQTERYIASFTSGVFAGVKLIINCFVGFIISVYVLSSKEKFAGQAKKITYALFKPKDANVIVDTVRKSNEIFGGFITGKLLDSLIIGILAYICLSVMKMPYTLLVSVIVGVTNIIPFFGPFIGAIPSFFIIVLQNPIQGLYFLIFVFVLQQVDGNIIGPKILGDSTGLSSFWVVFAITFFGGIWGFPGMLIGVPLTAVFYYIASRLITYRLHKKGIPEDTESYIKLQKIDKKTNEPIYEKNDVNFDK